MLWKMDWKRFQELVSMVLAKSGFGTEIAWVKPDGTTAMTVTTNRTGNGGEALLLSAGWPVYEIGAPMLLEFYKSAVSQGASRGIYVTPGRFDQNAKIMARMHHLELIDGTEFLATLARMSKEDQQFFLRMAMVGQWDVPTCPACNRKLELCEIAFPKGEDQRELRDVIFKDRQHVGSQLFCRNLVIKPGADILFLKGVEAESIHVEGRVMGDIICRGKLIVAAGAYVSGLVAARSIKLEPGGLLEAEARILNETEIQPVRAQAKPKVWKCLGRKKCHGMLPVRS